MAQIDFASAQNISPVDEDIPTSSGAGRSEWESWRLSPPPQGESGVGRWVWDKMSFAYKYRKDLGIDELWRHNHELYRGRFFKNPKAKITQIPVNLFFKTINRMKAELTDNEPQASISPRGGVSQEAAATLQEKYEEWWEDTRQQEKLQESVGQSEIYGCQTDWMLFNPETYGGLGEIETSLGDNFATLLWPGFIDIQQMPMIFRLQSLELDAIYRKWPKAEGKVKADPQLSEKLGDDRRETRANTTNRTIRPYLQSGYPGNFKPVDTNSRETEKYGIERALVVECWVKDYSMVWVNPVTEKRTDAKPRQKDLRYLGEQPSIDPLTGQPLVDLLTGKPLIRQVVRIAEPYQESKYKGFLRCIHVTNKGSLVLDDLDNPSINPRIPREQTSQCYLWDKFPAYKRLSYSDGLSEYGLTIIEQIEALVMEVAKKISKVGTHLDSACLPPIINPKGSGLEKRDINNLPGRVWEPTQTAANLIRYLPVPALPTDYEGFIRLLMLLIDVITGLTDVTEGRGGQGITAFAAIAALQEKAQAVLREKIRNLDTSIEEQGRMWISLAQNWYQFPSVISGKEFRGTDPQYQGRFAFRVEAGSTLPQNKWAQRGEALDLFKARVVDQQYVLEKFNIGKSEEIIQRMQKGPLFVAVQRLQKTGIFQTGATVQLTPQFLDALVKIIAMKEKEFEKLFPQAKAESQALSAMMQAGIPLGVNPGAEKVAKAVGPALMQPQQPMTAQQTQIPVAR